MVRRGFRDRPLIATTMACNTRSQAVISLPGSEFRVLVWILEFSVFIFGCRASSRTNIAFSMGMSGLSQAENLIQRRDCSEFLGGRVEYDAFDCSSDLRSPF